ncbi:MAG: dipeptidase [Candidatus Aminicenantes bacterium]|nr:dipeptidase [Candidatus Aminicenantes bacterium]MDH5743318.1 dipeptidase [Candidatus Aminicenantes bacterium]
MRQKSGIKWMVTLSVGLFLISCSPKEKEEALIARAGEIHERVLTVDTHADTPLHMLREDWNIAERHEPGERGSGNIDLPRMKEGGLDAEFFAVFVGQGLLTPESYARARERASRLLDVVHKMCQDHPDLVELATTPEDAYRFEKQGKRAAYIGLENGYPIGKDLQLVKEFYDRGVRYITLCHGGDNDICDSSTDRRNPEDNGLSEFGKQVVAECNRLGIMVDVSHISDKSFFDVIQVSKAPVIASHSSVHVLCDHPRNLSDEMLNALATNGGVIQICLVSSFLITTEPNPERDKALAELREKYGSWSDVKDEETREKMRQEYAAIREAYPEEKASVKDLVDHIDCVVDLVGVDHVGIGTDFDGGGGIEGCEDVSEMPHITEELLRRGYSEEDIQKIWGGNLMRVFREVSARATR